MCGRYFFTMTPDMEALFTLLGITERPPEGLNLAPTESVPIIIKGDVPELHLARWWLTPSWSSGPTQKYAMFNARAETLSSSRAFKASFRHRRCVMPASSYIEWLAGPPPKQPVEIHANGAPLLFAGIWDLWNDELLSCAMVTVEASGAMAQIHSRMPALLRTDDIDAWLSATTQQDDLRGLLRKNSGCQLYYHTLLPDINDAKKKIRGTPTGETIRL